jgi:BASS family bile acid:Na+ symporter
MGLGLYICRSIVERHGGRIEVDSVLGEGTVFSVVLPLVLAVVMFGLGLSLTPADFTRVLTVPKAVLVTLACQVLVLPVVCFGLVLVVDLEADHAIGMMLLVAAPGGVMAAVFSHLAGGDVALNITATAVNSLLALLTVPLVAAFALAWFAPGSARPVSVAPDKVVQVVVVVLVPVAVGMLVRRVRPRLAGRMHRPVQVASFVAVFLAIVTAVGQQFEGFLRSLAGIGLVTLGLSVLSLAIGYAVPRVVGIPHPRAVAASMEIGIHNAVVAITVAVSVLDNPAAAVPPAMYGALMFFPAAAFAWFLARRGAVRRVARPHGAAPS